MLEITPTESVIGARVHGISMADVPDDTAIEAIEVALEQHGVLVFPDQFISPRQQIEWSKAFAELDKTGLVEARLEGAEEIFVVGNIGKSIVAFASDDPNADLEWHTDHIQQTIPARASLLRALEVPEIGGDTLFACMYSAYDALTEEDKDEYDKLELIHHISGLDYYLSGQDLTPGEENRPEVLDGVVRPLVRAHPLTRRKSLYFGNKISVGIKGWPAAKFRAFIDQLTAHACQEKFRYCHKWSAGDAVLWDNRRVLHAGTPYDTKNTRRHMHRTTWKEDHEITLVKSVEN